MLLINGKQVFTTLDELVKPQHTALLLIDLQNDYLAAGGYVDKLGWNSSEMRQIVPRVRRVLDAGRQMGLLVVHIQMTLLPDYLADSPASLRMQLLRAGGGREPDSLSTPMRCIRGTWGWAIVDELAPIRNELVIPKRRPSAFIGTDLDMILRSNGVKSVALVGLATYGCVLATAFDARAFDYYTVLIRDCIASPQNALHEAAIGIMAQDMDIVTSEEVLGVWR